MAFPTVAATNGLNDAAVGTTHAVPLAIPAGGILANDVQLIIAGIDGTTAITPPDGTWNELLDASVGTTASARTGVWWKRMSGGETGTISFTTASEGGGWTSYCLRGVSLATTPVEVSTITNGAATANVGNPTALNPAGWDVEDTLWIACVAIDGNNTVTAAPTNYTSLTVNRWANTGGAAIGTALRTNAVASEDPGVFTHGAGQNGAFTIGVRALAPVGAEVNVHIQREQSKTTRRYRVARRPFVLKRRRRVIAAAVTRVTASWASSYAIRDRLTSTWQTSYKVRDRLTTAWQTSYAVRDRVTSTWQTSYKVRDRVTSAWLSSYGVKDRVTSTWQSSYAVKDRLGSSWQSSYKVRDRVTSSWQTSYAVKDRLGSTWQSSYKVRDRVTSAWQSSYAVRDRVTSTWVTSYNVGGRLSASWQSSYKVSARAASAWQSSYVVRKRQQSDWLSSYKVGARITTAWQSSYAVLAGAAVGVALGRHILRSHARGLRTLRLRRRSQPFITRGAIVLAAGPTRVTATWQSSYKVRDRLSTAWTTSYKVRDRLSASWATSYKVRDRVTTNWISSYNVGGRVSANWQSSYRIRARATRAWATSYTVRDRVTRAWASSYTVHARSTRSWPSGYVVRERRSVDWASAYILRERIVAAWASRYVVVSGPLDAPLVKSPLSVVIDPLSLIADFVGPTYIVVVTPRSHSAELESDGTQSVVVTGTLGAVDITPNTATAVVTPNDKTVQVN